MLRRSSLVLWALALALTALPYVISLTTGESGFLVVMGTCPGFELHSDVSMALLPLYAVPEPLIALVGFGLWLLLVRRGRPRWGRAAGWLAALGVTWPTLLTLGFAALDLVVNDGCGQTWGPFFRGAMAVGWMAGDVLTLSLILVAVRVRRTTPRGWIARTAVAVLAVLLLLGLQTGDRTVGKVTEAAEEKCRPWDLRYGTRPVSRTDRESAFVCVARGDEYVLPRRFRDLPDAELVAFGRNLCGASMRADPKELERLSGETGVTVGAVETTQALTLLCPEVDAREQAEEKRQDAENDAFIATAKKRCASVPPHRPRIRPAVRGTASMWSDYGAVSAFEGEEPPEGAALDKAFGNDLVGADKGELAILTADEAMHVCVTVEAYGTRPPVEREGWEKVVEIGYTSPKGELAWVEAESTLPNALLKGPGRYRVRVHMRGSAAAMEDDGDARQRFLVMVFPGSSRRTEVLR